VKIGSVAEAAGVSVQAVRFYEREGLLAVPARTRSGYRLYDPDTVARLHFIRRAQELGFTLKEIRELIALETRNGVDCDDVYGVAQAKVDSVQKKIDDLARMKTELESLIHSCSGCVPVQQCKIMECLNADCAH
jgi:Hg(II)-responsive transcriptional regulator